MRPGEARDLFVAELCEKIGVKAGNIINDDISRDTAGFVVLLPGDPVGGYNLRGKVLDLIKEFEPCILLDTTEAKLAMSFHVRYKDLVSRYESPG